MLIETFKFALQKVEQKCCDEDSSCYNCLRNYNNQLYHKLLKRKLAIEAFKEIFENIQEVTMGLIDSVIDVFRFKDAIFYKEGSICKINKMFKKIK